MLGLKQAIIQEVMIQKPYVSVSTDQNNQYLVQKNKLI